MRKQLAIAALAFLTVACSPTERAVQAAVEEGLKDPESARFGEFSVSSKGSHACISLNAKNSYGGYVGERQYYVYKVPGSKEWKSLIDSDENHQSCAEMIEILERKHFAINRWPSDPSVAMDDVSAIHTHKAEFRQRAGPQ